MGDSYIPGNRADAAARRPPPSPYRVHLTGASTVSAAIICRDEERDLPACLASVRWCDEIVVVVDSKTADGTERIAVESGARVFVRDWSGWAAQKNFAFSQCSGDWILSIDADERVTDELRDEIIATINSSGQAVGYLLPRRNFWLRKWIRHGGWYPDYTLRLFRRGHGTCRYLIHERIEVDGEARALRHDLVHEGVCNLSEHLVSTLRYTDAEVQEMLINNLRFYSVIPFQPLLAYLRDFLRGPKNSTEAYLLAKRHFKNRVEISWLVPFQPLLKFAHMYIWKQGYRDGAHGFWLAVLSASYVAIKYAKYWATTGDKRSTTGQHEPATLKSTLPPGWSSPYPARDLCKKEPSSYTGKLHKSSETHRSR